jgi:molybdopterin synthase catalytic subunit
VSTSADLSQPPAPADSTSGGSVGVADSPGGPVPTVGAPAGPVAVAGAAGGSVGVVPAGSVPVAGASDPADESGGAAVAPGAAPATTGLVALTAVVDETLDLAAHEAAVADPRAGAVVSFQGVVRDHDHGRGVTLLEYEGHPTAAAILREVAEEIAADPAVYAVAVSHRIGTLEIGDVALVASVSTAHRAAAFAACGRLVDEAKARLPIWKRQVFLDGTEEWVNCP